MGLGNVRHALNQKKTHVDRGVASGTGQVYSISSSYVSSQCTTLTLVLPVGDVQMRLGVAVLLGETEINHVDLVAALADAHEEVVGLDVAVNEVTRVDVLDARNLASVSESHG